MKITVKYVYIITSIIFLFYLLLPNPDFPEQLPDSIQSFEPADIETPLRRGYYTNMTRDEVMSFFYNRSKLSKFFNIPLPTYRLNYPPEEAQTLIRDQTRSTFLEEIVHPFRESFFINGFEPKEDKDMIFIDARKWRQKVIVKYVPNSPILRFLVGISTIIAIPFIYLQLTKSLSRLVKEFRNI